MTDERALQMIDVVERKSSEIFAELRAQLNGEAGITKGLSAATQDGDSGTSWSLSAKPPKGAWTEIKTFKDQSYTWPDGNVDDYTKFSTYEGSGGFEGMSLALGHKDNGEWVGFVFEGSLASKRGIVYFQLADDFETSGELLSMIRGGGAKGRSGFAPTDPTPSAYADFRIESLKSRKAGKWNVQAVVAASDDAEAMLNHTAIQARLRGLA